MKIALFALAVLLLILALVFFIQYRRLTKLKSEEGDRELARRAVIVDSVSAVAALVCGLIITNNNMSVMRLLATGCFGVIAVFSIALTVVLFRERYGQRTK